MKQTDLRAHKSSRKSIYRLEMQCVCPEKKNNHAARQKEISI